MRMKAVEERSGFRCKILSNKVILESPVEKNVFVRKTFFSLWEIFYLLLKSGLPQQKTISLPGGISLVNIIIDEIGINGGLKIDVSQFHLCFCFIDLIVKKLLIWQKCLLPMKNFHGHSFLFFYSCSMCQNVYKIPMLRIYIKQERSRQEKDMSERRGFSIAAHFIIRAVIGMAVIYGLNLYLESQQISVAVGMNPISFLTSAVLGIPGVALLYAILFYQIL